MKYKPYGGASIDTDKTLYSNTRNILVVSKSDDPINYNRPQHI
jgi:hypothetical protein